jgi:hypothetical protein
MTAINGARGEVAITTASGTLFFRYTTHALCALESATGSPIGKFLGELQDWEKNPASLSIATLVKMVWAGLIAWNQEITEDGAAAVMDEIGIHEAVTRASEALLLSLPREETSGANPRTGVTASSGRRSANRGSKRDGPTPNSGR